MGFLIFFLVLIVVLIPVIYYWVKAYNQFIYWGVRAQQEKENISILLQKRTDNLLAITEMVKRYDIHEHSTLQDVIKERGTNEEPSLKTENNVIKALVEQYPTLKADQLHATLMARTSQVEDQLNQIRVAYNFSAQRYNRYLQLFPQNLVAAIHHFNILPYLAFEKQAEYTPENITKMFAR